MTREEQRRRFMARETDPLKQWKLSPIDKASLDKWDDYTEAKEAMFFYTDTADAPWTIVKSDDKKRARLEAMQHFLSSIDYPGKDHRVVREPDPLIVGRAEHVVHRSEHILGTSLHPDHRACGTASGTSDARTRPLPRPLPRLRAAVQPEAGPSPERRTHPGNLRPHPGRGPLKHPVRSRSGISPPPDATGDTKGPPTPARGVGAERPSATAHPSRPP